MDDNQVSQLERVTEALQHASPRNEQDRDALLEMHGLSFPQLVRTLEDSEADTGVRQAVCWILARLGSKRRSARALVSILDDWAADTALRAEAARSLGILGSEVAHAPLVGAMLNDPSDEVRKAAAYGLGALHDKAALAPMVHLLQDEDASSDLRGMVAEQLSNLRDARALGPLMAVLVDAPVEVRFWAAYSLGRLGDMTMIPLLSRVASTDHAVRPPYGSVGEEASQAIAAIRDRASPELHET